MTDAVSTERPEIRVGISGVLRWTTARGAALFLATAFTLGILGTVSGAVVKGFLLDSDGLLQALAYALPAMLISYLILYFVTSGMISVIADPSIRVGNALGRGKSLFGYWGRRDYAFLLAWLSVVGPTVALTAYVLANVLGADGATNVDAIGYTVLLCLAVLVHACQRVLVSTPKANKSADR